MVVSSGATGATAWMQFGSVNRLQASMALGGKGDRLLGVEMEAIDALENGQRQGIDRNER